MKFLVDSHVFGLGEGLNVAFTHQDRNIGEEPAEATG